MSPPQLSDLVFSEQANHNFSRILGDLKRANLSITNRLRSILQDARFVEQVASAYGLPLVANERCGSWYIDPTLKAASAYFKSTDGHTGQWKFSTRRLNLHLLDLIERHNGCIIVDSTRRGKRMPDALSKTIPIWCTVLNRTLFPSDPTSHTLRLPPNVVSASEQSQIEALIPSFVASFHLLNIDIPSLRARLTKPLRPIWRVQDDFSAMDRPEAADRGFEAFHPVICCSSSRRVVAGAEMSEGGYIQGAGDDTENWAHGLTAPVFWEHKEELLAMAEADLPDRIAELVAGAGAAGGEDEGVVREVTPHIAVCSLASGCNRAGETPDRTRCLVSLVPATTPEASWAKSRSELEVGVGKHKAASRNLRHALPAICDFVARFLESESGSGGSAPGVLVRCESGKDLSVGVALALDCWCFDDDGKVRRPRRGEGEEEVGGFTKEKIRVRLGRIMTAMPEANPSRATLQSVNSFLMDWRK